MAFLPAKLDELLVGHLIERDCACILAWIGGVDVTHVRGDDRMIRTHGSRPPDGDGIRGVPRLCPPITTTFDSDSASTASSMLSGILRATETPIESSTSRMIRIQSSCGDANSIQPIRFLEDGAKQAGDPLTRWEPTSNDQADPVTQPLDVHDDLPQPRQPSTGVSEASGLKSDPPRATMCVRMPLARDEPRISLSPRRLEVEPPWPSGSGDRCEGRPRPPSTEASAQGRAEDLKEMRGFGTELVTVIIPPDRQISDVRGHLQNEHGQAANIKSKGTRKNVQGAIESALSSLNRHRSAGNAASPSSSAP